MSLTVEVFMRWGKYNTPELGSTRTDRFFLIFPITIDGETRWLEMATIRYKWYTVNGELQEIELEWVDD